MTPTEMITSVRSVIRDVSDLADVSDDDAEFDDDALLAHLNEGLREIVRLARIPSGDEFDGDTVTVSGGSASLSIPSGIDIVTRVYTGEDRSAYPLTKRSPGTIPRTTGTPHYWAEGFVDGSITIGPVPTEDTDVLVGGFSITATAMTLADEEGPTELKEAWHYMLVDYACFKALGSIADNTDGLDILTKASKHEKRYQRALEEVVYKAKVSRAVFE